MVGCYTGEKTITAIGGKVMFDYIIGFFFGVGVIVVCKALAEAPE